MKHRAFLLTSFLPSLMASALLCPAVVGQGPIKLAADATDAGRHILHARLAIPVNAGPLTLCYPKWIPGEHAPDGPIADLAGIKIKAGSKTVPWTRDAIDMFEIHCDVPAGAQTLDVELDFLMTTSQMFSAGASATSQLIVISWNQIILYPKGSLADTLQVQASLRLPPDWKFGTALPVKKQSGGQIEFAPVSLTQLVDSPVAAGKHFLRVALGNVDGLSHELDIVADSAAALEIKPEDETGYKNLVAETGALFGARHYRSYHFLYSLSDHIAHFGLEHHESSDDRVPEQTLTDDNLRKTEALLLPHEMTHSWNGKFRRPAEMIAKDFQEPIKTDLLWVYEGLTDYLTFVLTTRCGLWKPETYREHLARTAAQLDLRPGRAWRPLLDTTRAAQILYPSAGEWASWRRGVDFYDEGNLIWLDADVLIRTKTRGQKSLDDFCRAFFGGTNSAPAVVPYTFDQLIEALNGVAPEDWRKFFHDRVEAVEPRAPVGGIEGSGWKLVYKEEIPDLIKAMEAADKVVDLTYSIGMIVAEDGAIKDVLPGKPAAQAGIAPGMKLVAVNGRKWTPEILRESVKATKAQPMELLVENSDYFRNYRLEYRNGARYPHLERVPEKPDLLEKIVKPRGLRAQSASR